MIVVENLVKSFKATRVLQGVDHVQQRGEAVVLIGPSGCGKSTFLRCLNQLELADAGRITIGEVTVLGGQAPRTAQEKELQRRLRQRAGMVFQSFNLFPHLTVLENVTTGPRIVKGAGKEDAAARARELLGKVGLQDKAFFYPGQLSGGQQQRVALARADWLPLPLWIMRLLENLIRRKLSVVFKGGHRTTTHPKWSAR